MDKQEALTPTGHVDLAILSAHLRKYAAYSLRDSTSCVGRDFIVSCV